MTGSVGSALMSERARRAQRMRDVVRAEFLKARSLRVQSLLWAAGALGALVGTAAALLFASILGSIDADLPPGEVARLVERAPVAGAGTAALLWGFAAIHLTANERATGRERLTDIEVPSRGRTFVARLAVVIMGAGVLAACTSALAGAATASYVLASGGTPHVMVRDLVEWAVVALATSLCVAWAACLGLAIRNGVVAAATHLTVFVILPAVLGSVAATSRQEGYAWAASMMPAGRLGFVVDASGADEVLPLVSACGVLLVWLAGATTVAWLRWRVTAVRSEVRR